MRNWTNIDNRSNITTIIRPLTNQLPTLNVPGDNYVEATSSAGAKVNYVATATAALPDSSSSGSTVTDKDFQQARQLQ